MRISSVQLFHCEKGLAAAEEARISKDCRRYGNIVFMMFEPVVPVNTGTSVTGTGCVVEKPDNGRFCPHLARRELADADGQHTPRIAASDLGVCGRVFCPSSPIRMNFMSGKSAMSCSAYSSLCCTPEE